MRRCHLFEIADQPWCPRLLRDAATDFLQFMLHLGRNYAPAAPRLRDLRLSGGGCSKQSTFRAGGGVGRLSDGWRARAVQAPSR